MIHLTKEEYLELLNTLEIRNLTIGLEVSLDHHFEQKKLTDKQEKYLTRFENLQHKIYSYAKDYGLEKEFEIHPDTELLALKSNSKLHSDVFNLIEKHEKAVTYDLIVSKIIMQQVKQVKQEKKTEELQFSELTPIIQAIAKNIHAKLIRQGLSSVLQNNLDDISNLEIMNQTFNLFSEVAIKLGYAEFTSQQIEKGTIGNPPASKKKIKLIEQKLNIILPNDYKELLLITNGFSAPNNTDPCFLPIEKIEFLRNIDKNIIDAYHIEGIEDIGKQLERSILIGGMNEEQYFLLIPPDSETDKWRYWKFANWIPGEEEYLGIESYLKQVIEFNLEEIKTNLQ